MRRLARPLAVDVHARIREDGAGGHQDQQRESILLDRRTATSRQAIPRATPRLDIGGIAISHSVEVDERHPAVWPNDDVAGGDIPMHHAADAQGIPDIGKGPEELYQAVAQVLAYVYRVAGARKAAA